MIRKFFFIAPNNPPNARIDKTVLVSGSTYIRHICKREVHIDTLDARDLESEFHTWCCKGTEKSARRSVHVNWNINPHFLFTFIKKFSNFLNGFVVTGLSRSKNEENPCRLATKSSTCTNGVLVEMLANFSEVNTVIGLFANGNNSCLNFKIPRKFPTHESHSEGDILKGDLGVGTHQDIRI